MTEPLPRPSHPRTMVGCMRAVLASLLLAMLPAVGWADDLPRKERLAAQPVVALASGQASPDKEQSQADTETAELLGPETKDLSAWQDPTGQWQIVGDVKLDPQDPSKFVNVPGTGVVVNGAQGRTSHLFSKLEHGDVEAHIEFVVPKGSNSGVYFQGRYEVQILDSWGVEEPKYGDCGGIYQRWDNGRGYEGHGPKVNASGRPGEWQVFDVVFRAPRFDAQGRKIAPARFVRVVHNGRVIHENVEVSGPTRAAAFQDEQPTGPLMIQGDHGPVAFRNIRLRALPPER